MFYIKWQTVYRDNKVEYTIKLITSVIIIDSTDSLVSIEILNQTNNYIRRGQLI